MACKKGNPGNPCCSPCLNCEGNFRVTGVSIAGTWGSSGSDDSPSCPTCIVPGTFLFTNGLSRSQLYGTESTPSGLQQCGRSVYQVGNYCQNQIYDDYVYTDAFGFWKKTRTTIYLREYMTAFVTASFLLYGGSSIVGAGIVTRWICEFWSKTCEFTTVNTYGYSPGGRPAALAAARAAELDAACLYSAPGSDPSTGGWKACETLEVQRSVGWSKTLSGSCIPVCQAFGSPTVGSSERIFYRNTNPPFFVCSGGSNLPGTLKWEKDLDGSTPALGDWTSTQQRTQNFFTSTGDGTLTGTIREQAFRLQLIGHNDVNDPNSTAALPNLTYREPCWPTAPTAILTCNPNPADPPPDP